MKKYYVYILMNYGRTVLYIGITSTLEERVYQHRSGMGSGFTSKYKVFYLVYFEEYTEPETAISREKQLKSWNRDWKLDLIKKSNPFLLDLMREGMPGA